MKDFIVFILFLLLIAIISFYFFDKYSQTPNKYTQIAAQSIPKFPLSTNWQIKNGKNICIPGFGTCSQPISIFFESQKDWGEIYIFYKDQMTKNGWLTNTRILTSIPTSIVFTSTSGCTAELSTYDAITNVVKKIKNIQFKFSVVCPPIPAS